MLIILKRLNTICMIIIVECLNCMMNSCLVGYDLQNFQGNPAIIPIMLIFIRHEFNFIQFLSDLISNTINPLSEHGIFCPLDFDQLPLFSGSIELIRVEIISIFDPLLLKSAGHKITSYTVHSDKIKTRIGACSSFVVQEDFQ